jgi:hypothetical protein
MQRYFCFTTYTITIYNDFSKPIYLKLMTEKLTGNYIPLSMKLFTVIVLTQNAISRIDRIELGYRSHNLVIRFLRFMCNL